MSLYKRNGIYWFEFVDGGRRYRQSTKVKNQRAAGDIERAFRTALAKGEVGITERKSIPAFRMAMGEFLQWSAQAHGSSSHRRYVTSSIALLQYFRDSPLNKITPEEVERFKTTRAVDCKTVRDGQKRVKTQTRLRPATVNRELACLKALFNFVIKADVPVKNPVSRVKFLAENNQQTRVLSYTEQQAYLESATPVLSDIATLILETGMRPEEVYKLRFENVDLSKGWLRVPRGKTPAARRELSLTKAASSVLRRRSDTLEGHYFFPCDTDPSRHIPKINNAHDRAVKLSKVRAFRLYDLRHTWATRAAMSGTDPVTLAAMLGHSRIQMVLRYAHPTQGHQTKAMQRLEEFNAHEQAAEFERLGAVSQNAIQVSGREYPQTSPQHLNDKTFSRRYVIEEIGGAGRDRTGA